ncbi:MAG: HupE/UreJ family protein [Gammaproteobacteria bacterium]|nr:HupE/UreJ family protein [Gammaproteobacteria bacterium]
MATLILRAGVLAILLLAANIGAHPEDEFCVPGEDSLDPALCEALAELDSAAGPLVVEKPILDSEGNVRGWWSTASLYLSIGVRHILPGGLDHILFVLALFLSSTRLKALVIQISTFTVAHTATLGLAAAGVLSPSAGIVEPLIAATIAFVAIENLFLTDMPKWRPLVVFLFGLVHGLGFAGFFGELGLPPGQFWSALIGFNVGVEVGQLTVVLVAFVLSVGIRRRLEITGHSAAYRRYVVVPASLLIGLIGLWWCVSRILAQLA